MKAKEWDMENSSTIENTVKTPAVSLYRQYNCGLSGGGSDPGNWSYEVCLHRTWENQETSVKVYVACV